jgi:hypothetical protein
VNDHPSATPVVAPDAAVADDSHQQCGRCRRVFEMEPTNEPGTLPELWFCASCRVALLGRPSRATKPLA